MVNPTNRNDAAIVPARCSVCAHPDSKQFDDDLLLRRKTQAEVARQVGVDRSSVSRHFKNHLLPNLATEVITREYSVMNIADQIDRVYGRAWIMFEEATTSGDYRLARDLLRELRLTLGLVMTFAGKVADGGIQRFVDQTVEGQKRKADEAWEILETNSSSWVTNAEAEMNGPSNSRRSMTSSRRISVAYGTMTEGPNQATGRWSSHRAAAADAFLGEASLRRTVSRRKRLDFAIPWM